VTSRATRRIALAGLTAVATAGSGLAVAAAGSVPAAPVARTESAQTTQASQVAAGSGGGPAAVLAGMNEQQRVGQLFMAGVAATGPVSSAISSDITTYHTGSVILTGRSSAGVTATQQLTSQLQGLATGAATDGVPLFIATDQEGGNVQVLSGPGFSTMPTALSQGSESAGELEQNADVWGSQLAAAGVNMNLAPVLDTVPQSEASTNQPIGIYQREYGYTPGAVTTAGTAFIEGMHEAGVSVTIKHFPGLGRADGNTDTTYGVTDDVTTYNDAYLQPYSTAERSYGAGSVMVSEAIYTLIDPSHQAVFSPTVIGGMLRSELGFHGMVMSDSMEATAVDELTPAEQAVDFINAGGDVVLATDPTVIPAMYNAVLSEAESNSSFATLVNQAALTVLIAKEQGGLVGGTVGAASTAAGQGIVVERETSSSLVAFTQSGGTWSGPVSLDGQSYDQPAAAGVPGSTRSYTVVTGTNRAAYLHAFNGNTPAGTWSSLGGTVTAPPGIAAEAGGEVAVAVRGTDHAIYVAIYSPATGRWGGFTRIGGTALDDPVGATFTPSGDLDVFVTGTNSAVYVNTLHDGSWSGWQSLGGTAVGGPDAVTIPGGPVQVFAQGEAGAAYVNTYSGTTWSGWVSIGGVLTTSLAAATPASGSSWVVGDGTNGQLYQNTYSGGVWSGWQQLPFD
jgi:beta-N-acetylhexosaminidase